MSSLDKYELYNANLPYRIKDQCIQQKPATASRVVDEESLPVGARGHSQRHAFCSELVALVERSTAGGPPTQSHYTKPASADHSNGLRLYQKARQEWPATHDDGIDLVG